MAHVFIYMSHRKEVLCFYHIMEYHRKEKKKKKY